MWCPRGTSKQELDPLVLGALEETARLIGVTREEQDRVGRSYLASVERLGFGA